MKIFSAICVFLLLIIITHSPVVQLINAHPKLFNGVKNKISYQKVEQEKIFAKTRKSIYQRAPDDNFKFAGTVISSYNPMLI